MALLELSKVWSEIDLSIVGADHSRILQRLNELEEYEGTFVKNMLKINNIVTNLITLCEVTQDMDILPVLQEIEQLLVKGIVNADSLHILN